MLSRVGSVVWQPDQVVLVVDGVCDGGAGRRVRAELAVQLGYLVVQATVFVVEFRMRVWARVSRCRRDASELRWVWSITGGLVGRWW